LREVILLPKARSHQRASTWTGTATRSSSPESSHQPIKTAMPKCGRCRCGYRLLPRPVQLHVGTYG
jgi:hypothetical protein